MICDQCGARVTVIETKDGKKIKCDASPVYFWVNGKGKHMFFTLRGDAFRGDISSETRATGHGYVSHYGMCKARQKLAGIVDSGRQMRIGEL